MTEDPTFLSLKIEPENKEEPEVVVRLKTSCWSDKRGIHTKRSLTYLKRKCKGYNILEEDASNIGADEVFPRIVNLDECEDGVYYVITTNVQTDWESGDVEDYDYRLVPSAY